MPNLVIAVGDATLRALLENSPDFTVRPLDTDPKAVWPEFGRDTVIVMDQSRYAVMDEEKRLRLRTLSLLLIVSASLPPETTAAYRTGDIKLFYDSGHDPFGAENLLGLVRAMAERATLAERLDSYIRDSFRDIIDSTLLQRQKEEIEALNEKLRIISRIDPLTNLLNRRALLEAFDQEKRRAQRHRWRLRQSGSYEPERRAPSRPADFRHVAKGSLEQHIGNFACLMIDIDHFKRVNDSYGHLTGDRVLRAVSDVLGQPGIFRDTDVKGRYGGEEFIVLLTETNSANSLLPAERLAEAVRNTNFAADDGRTFRLTLSIGIADFLPGELSCDEMIKRADTALYYAKEHGRDQIHVFADLPIA